MVKKILLLALLLTSCASVEDHQIVDEDLFEVKNEDKLFYRDVFERHDYYFSYNVGDRFDGGKFVIDKVDQCQGEYGFIGKEEFDLWSAGDEVKNSEKDGVGIREYYLGKELQGLSYYYDLAILGEGGLDLFYHFRVLQEGDRFKECKNLVFEVAKTFSEEREYVNDQFGFSAYILPNYQLDYLPGGSGVRMTREFSFYDEKLRTNASRVVTIEISAVRNLQKWSDIFEMIAERYSGFTMEFLKKGDLDGIIVDEGLGELAVKRFIIFSKKSDFIYEIILKTESVIIADYFYDFGKIVESFRLF